MPEVRELISWTEVEGRLGALLRVDDPVLAAALADSDAAGMPAIDVSPLEGRLLQLVARIIGARRILEVGTLGGYSTIWLARALPSDGRLITLEIDPSTPQSRAGTSTRAGLAERWRSASAGRARASRPSRPSTRAVRSGVHRRRQALEPGVLHLGAPADPAGSVIVVDNVAKRLAEGDAADPDVLGTRRVLELMGAEPRLSATALQTVGRKGRDGFALALVLPGPDAP